jgi:hypothetical protein
MADALVVEVVTQETTPAQAMLRQTIFWGWLIVAPAVGRVWFGGSVMLDIAALVLALLVLVLSAMRLAGKSVKLTRAQAIAWAQAGAPTQVKAWKDAKYG